MDKRKEALEFAKSVPSVSLGTVEKDIPHIRIMAIAGIEDDFTVWFSTSAHSNKMNHIKNNPYSCVVFYTGHCDLKIIGKAYIIEDKAIKDQLYIQEWDRHYPNGGKDDPDYAVIKITPESVEYRNMEKYGLAPIQII